MEIHCYNENCINGIELKNCTHEGEDCMKNMKYPAIVSENPDGTHNSFYCETACKAKVVMTDYVPHTAAHRTPMELKYQLQRMRQTYLEQKGLNK